MLLWLSRQSKGQQPSSFADLGLKWLAHCAVDSVSFFLGQIGTWCERTVVQFHAIKGPLLCWQKEKASRKQWPCFLLLESWRLSWLLLHAQCAIPFSGGEESAYKTNVEAMVGSTPGPTR